MSISHSLPKSIDTVIIGNGPAALILSYLLHGNCPFYDTSSNQHPDSILDAKLNDDLLESISDTRNLTAHFPSSRFSYSTAALPVNILLDTLLRPLADTEPDRYKPCVRWKQLPGSAVPHILLSATESGGQWVSNPVRASWDIGALSYLDQLSLPGYTLRDHLKVGYSDQDLDFLRPTRSEIAEYLAAYPAAVGISDAIAPPSNVADVSRTEDGFYIGSHSMSCRHLVLASGIFSNLLPARPPLQPLLTLSESHEVEPPLLVVGSGFSAADILITNLPKQKIIHIFKWNPEHRPSPLRACHKQAYPEYAGIYRQMKLAAASVLDGDQSRPNLTRRKSNTLKNIKADINYEGFPNTFIEEARVEHDVGIVRLRLPDGNTMERTISNLAYVIGRRGSLSYLSSQLRAEVVGKVLCSEDSEKISGRTLREKVEEDLEVTENVFVIGSLTGDSLIRHAYGSCVYTAAKIMSSYRIRPASMDIVSHSKSQNENERPIGNDGAVDTTPATSLPTDSSQSSKADVEMETVEANRRAGWERCGLSCCTVS